MPRLFPPNYPRAMRPERPARQGGVLVNCFLAPTRLGLVMLVVVVAAFGSLTGASSAFGKSQTPGASFQGLGQMPGATTGGTSAFGISGDGSVIVGAGWVSSFEQEAFRWTLTGGYQLLGDLGGGNSIADAASLDGSVVVGIARD